jgi:hypothetical protein
MERRICCGIIGKGEKVRIKEVKNLKLHVEPINKI